jgi:hypothetical protein
LERFVRAASMARVLKKVRRIALAGVALESDLAATSTSLSLSNTV